MNSITDLFSQYSIESIILFVLSLGVAINFIGDLWDSLYSKLRKYFKYQNQKDQNHKEILDGIQAMTETVTSLQENIGILNKRTQKLEDKASLTNERLQENTRSYIIDKHHYFCYKKLAIDDFSLQSLERRYLFYKASEGDSYIDGLMEEIRELPRITSYTNFDTLQRKE